MFEVYEGLRSISVTCTPEPPHTFRYLAAASPAMPPPTTTTRPVVPVTTVGEVRLVRAASARGAEAASVVAGASGSPPPQRVSAALKPTAPAAVSHVLRV